jgi:sigma-B regulation protein RsbU (phosphoserine phosphatase)
MLASRILIADDSELQRILLSHCLAAAGFTNLVCAVDGLQALRLYDDLRPELLILDNAMPGLTGLEVCQALTARPSGAAPILVQSALDRPEDRVKAFQAGAADFVSKPIYPPELVARVRLLLENRWMLRTLQTFKARLGDELAAARAMQEALLPSPADLRRARIELGLDIAAYCETSSELGGDFWGLRILEGQRLSLFLADVSGHGVGSAVTAFRLHALLQEQSDLAHRPDSLMQRLNAGFARLLPLGTFATAFCAMLDLRANRLEYCAAGAPAPLLVLPDGTPAELDATGLPIGIDANRSYELRSVRFPPGASLFMHSDALTETPDAAGLVWDDARLRSFLAALPADGSAGSGLADLRVAFDPGRSRPLPDDLTLIFLRSVIEVEAPS